MTVFDRVGICCLAVALMGWTGGLSIGNSWMSLTSAVLMIVGTGVLSLGALLQKAWYDWQQRRWERSPEGQAWRAKLEAAVEEWIAEQQAAQ